MYFVTILTKQRRRQFVKREVVETCHSQFLRAARLRGFSIVASCYMPDHLHVLLEALKGDANLSTFMKMAKQLSAYHVKRAHGVQLWAKGYHDRIVRHDDDPQRYLSYIRQNPVKARLVAEPEDYPFLWVDARFSDHLLARPSGRASSNRPYVTTGKSSPD